MLDTPKYRIGPSDFFSPGDLQADADTLNAQVQAIGRALFNGSPTLELLDGWNAFVARWRAFYEDHWGGIVSDWFTALNDANRDQLIAFEIEAGQWAQRAQSAGVSIPDPIYSPSEGSGDTLGNHLGEQLKNLPSATSLTVLIVVGVAAYFLVKKYG